VPEAAAYQDQRATLNWHGSTRLLEQLGAAMRSLQMDELPDTLA
jgi:hypothetical protein